MTGKTVAELALLVIITLVGVAGSNPRALNNRPDVSKMTNCGAMPLGSADVGPPPVGEAWSLSADCSGPFVVRVGNHWIEVD